MFEYNDNSMSWYANFICCVCSAYLRWKFLYELYCCDRHSFQIGRVNNQSCNPFMNNIDVKVFCNEPIFFHYLFFLFNLGICCQEVPRSSWDHHYTTRNIIHLEWLAPTFCLHPDMAICEAEWRIVMGYA